MKVKIPRGYKPVALAPEEISEEDLRAEEDEVFNILGLQAELSPDMAGRFAAAESVQDYFPGANTIPNEGAWVMVKNPPHTEFTVPPMSFWFATNWPHDPSGNRPQPKRVKIVTPRGDLGLYPHEYSRVENIEKYYEFFDQGMEMKFFGPTKGVPDDALFYLRSRGIGKEEAVKMLVGQIKAHGVCWIESSRQVCSQFGKQWPCDERNAAIITKDLQ